MLRAAIVLVMAASRSGAQDAPGRDWALRPVADDRVECAAIGRADREAMRVKAGQIGLRFTLGIHDGREPHRLVDVVFDSAGGPLSLTLIGSRPDDGTGQPQTNAHFFGFTANGGWGRLMTRAASAADTSRDSTTQRDATSEEVSRARAIASTLWDRRCLLK